MIACETAWAPPSPTPQSWMEDRVLHLLLAGGEQAVISAWASTPAAFMLWGEALQFRCGMLTGSTLADEHTAAI